MGTVTETKVVPIGGKGYIGDIYKVQLTWHAEGGTGPAQIIAKLTSPAAKLEEKVRNRCQSSPHPHLIIT